MLKKIKDLSEKELQSICDKHYDRRGCKKCPLEVIIPDDELPYRKCLFLYSLNKEKYEKAIEKEVEVEENDK